MFGNLGQLTDLIRNAGKMREMMEKAGEAMGELRAEGTAGGGLVSVVCNGRQEFLSVKIDPSLLSQGDAELLEDLVLAALNQALTKSREVAAESFLGSMGGAGGGNPLGGLSGLLGGPPFSPGSGSGS